MGCVAPRALAEDSLLPHRERADLGVRLATVAALSRPGSRPRPPYWAVIFTSKRTPRDAAGYEAAANRMLELAREQPGFLGVESARGSDGMGITVSYWSSREAISDWKRNAEHLRAQARGRAVWYADFELRVARVEEARHFESETPSAQPRASSG
jgi:heme-degrading monooxygenase HmoA